MIETVPHCDARVLHAPGECAYCDEHPEWQRLRAMWGIAFTGHPASPDGLPCPADNARPPGSLSDHRQWGGNKPTTARADDPAWPQETPASLMLYGDPDERYINVQHQEAPAPRGFSKLLKEIRYWLAIHGI